MITVEALREFGFKVNETKWRTYCYFQLEVDFHVYVHFEHDKVVESGIAAELVADELHEEKCLDIEFDSMEQLKQFINLIMNVK